MRHTLFLFLVFSLFIFKKGIAQDLCVPVGWATQNGGTAGGGNGTSSTVGTYDELKTAILSYTVKLVFVQGTINFPDNGRISISNQHDKTIIGLPDSKIVAIDKTKRGSGIFYFKNCTNVILRNLYLEGPGAYDIDGNDNLTLDNCQNVWVDHCAFFDGMDGNFDIKNKSDFISVTWCTFNYEKSPKAGGSGGADDHRFSNLIGSSDESVDDEGKLRITFQYCWWGQGCVDRMPRVRFGKIHLVNNLYTGNTSRSCIRGGFKADLLIESNVFIGVKKPIVYRDDCTAVSVRNNLFTNTSVDTTGRGVSFIPPYAITITPVDNLELIVKQYAGAKLFLSPCNLIKISK